ncbi:hypothetical protein ACT4UM_01120, partial [Bacillus sp. SS-TM]
MAVSVPVLTAIYPL